MIFVTGDIHGDADEFADRLRRHMQTEPPTGDDAIICCGDVGLRYGRTRSRNLMALMASSPYDFIILRGNHDARYQRCVQGDTVRRYGIDMKVDPLAGNILYAPDTFAIAETEGYGTWLLIGGAWSIDWGYRQLMGYPFEMDEKLTSVELTELKRAVKAHPNVDYVFSHTAPYSWFDHVGLAEGVSQSQCDHEMEHVFDDVLDAVSPTLKRPGTRLS